MPHRALVGLRSGSRRSALVCAFGPCLGDADEHPLAGQLPLELSDGAKQVEHEPAGRRGSVDRLIQHFESDALGFQIGTYLAQMRNAPGELLRPSVAAIVDHGLGR